MFSKLFRTICQGVFFSLLGVLCACGSSSKKPYEIAVDPLWYPLELMGREKGVLGFSTDLLKEISQEESIQFSLLSTNWDSLMEGLSKKNYQGILSSLYPYDFNEKIYRFSHLYLKTGPVLVVPLQSPFNAFSKLGGKEVGVITGSPSVLIVEKYPEILIRSYDTIPHLLNDLAAGHLDGAVIPILAAEGYVQDLYKNQLQIVTPPLNEEGLRLITLKSENPTLIEKFNEGLAKLEENKRYNALLIKWGLKGNSL